MKTRFFTLLLFACATFASAAVVDESDSEFFTSVDADGDGLLDQVLVDRETGAIRLGYQTAPETVAWSDARVTGLDKISGVGAARFFVEGRVSLALANPESSSVVLVDPTDHTAAFTPIIRFPFAHGPSALAGLTRSPGTPDDIFVGAKLGDPPQPDTLSVMQPDGTTVTVPPVPVEGLVERTNPIFLKTGAAEAVAMMIRLGDGSSEFRVYDHAANPPTLLAAVAGLTSASAWVSDRFDGGSSFAQALFYTPGSPQLRVRTVQQPAADYVFGPETLFTFTLPVSQMVVVPDLAGPRLLVIFDDGATATMFTFDGVNAPQEVSSMDAAPGQRFSGASALGGGHFTLMSGPASERRSTDFHQYRRDAAGNYSEVASGALPIVGNHIGRANVFVFALEPFVNRNALVKSVLLAPDWSSQFSFSNNMVRVTQETFLGDATGLANPTSVLLGPTPVGGAFGLVNQFRADAAMNSFRAPYATDADDVTITPPAGHYPNAIKVTLASRDDTKFVFYRPGPTQPWQFYSGPAWVALDTVVEFYAENLATGERTPIRSAQYTFPGGGVDCDLDGDRVPDFVEIAHGLDPNSGLDADGDGYSDLQEILAGTDPNDASNFPSDPPGNPFAQGFDLTVQPVIYYNFTYQPQSKSPGIDITARDLNGLILAIRKTINVPLFAGPPPSVAQFFGFRAPVGPFFAVGTESFFAVAVPYPPASTFVYVGAERVGLVMSPDDAGNGIVYLPQGGTLVEEADAWRIAALAASHNAPAVAATLSPLDTLSGLVVERKLRDILTERGIADATLANLFPYRSTADLPHAIAPNVLTGLATRDNAGHPAYDLRGVRSTIEDGVKNNPAPNIEALRRVALDIYQTFEHGRYPINYPPPPGVTYLVMQPVDALRLFLNGQPLPDEYLAVATLTDADRASALQGLAEILSAATSRPYATFTVELLADSFRSECSVVHDVDGNRDVALYDYALHPWRFFGSIIPPPGSRALVVAYTDLPAPSAGCSTTSLGVISFALTSFPPETLVDTDGDGLPDPWENAVFGNLDQTGTGDPDADGADNATEFLAGTDPLDMCSMPLLPVAPILHLVRESGGGIDLFWDYPIASVASVTFSLETTTDFALWSPLNATITNPFPGHYDALLPTDSAPKRFYRLRVTAH